MKSFARVFCVWMATEVVAEMLSGGGDQARSGASRAVVAGRHGRLVAKSLAGGNWRGRFALCALRCCRRRYRRRGRLETEILAKQKWAE